MSDLFNVFSKQNWCRFLLAILLSWAFTYTGGMGEDGASSGLWGTFQKILKDHLSIEDAKTTFFILLILVYFIVYPVLDKFLNLNETVCPMFEGTNPLESSMDNDAENENDNENMVGDN